MLTFPETLYFMELEGDIPTKTGKINAVVKEIKKMPYLINDSEFFQVLENHDLSFNDLTNEELLDIINRINK